jgi:WD40 repeat protein
MSILNLGVFNIQDDTSNILVDQNNNIVYGNYRGEIVVVNKNNITNILVEKNACINCIDIFKNILVAGTNSGKIIIFDLNDHSFKTIKSHVQEVNSVSYNGNYIVSGSNDGTCKLYKNEKFFGTLIESRYPIKKVKITNDNIIMCSGLDGYARIWIIK